MKPFRWFCFLLCFAGLTAWSCAEDLEVIDKGQEQDSGEVTAGGISPQSAGEILFNGLRMI